MTDFNFDTAAYDKLLKEADRDTAVGKHTFVVNSVTEGAWPDGRPRFDFDGTLATNGNMRFKFSLNPPEPPEVIADEQSPGKKRAMLLNVKSWAALAKAGFKSPDKIAAGDAFQIEIYREKPKDGRDIGYLRLSHVVGPATSGASDNIPGF